MTWVKFHRFWQAELSKVAHKSWLTISVNITVSVFNFASPTRNWVKINTPYTTYKFIKTRSSTAHSLEWHDNCRLRVGNSVLESVWELGAGHLGRLCFSPQGPVYMQWEMIFQKKPTYSVLYAVAEDKMADERSCIHRRPKLSWDAIYQIYRTLYEFNSIS